MTHIKSHKRVFILAAAMVAVFVFTVCSDNLSGLNKYYSGRTLHVNVVEIDRAQEVRYATIDPEQVIRHWRILPSAPGLELVLVRMKVANHMAINAVLDVDQQAVELRDFFQSSYFSIDWSKLLYQDLRNQAEVTVRMSLGECFDPRRMYISGGTRVGWLNEDPEIQYIDLDGDGRDFIPINPGDTLYREFNAPGEASYQCSTDGKEGRAGKLVVDDEERSVDQRSLLFITGPFQLKKGEEIDGWLVFEAPEGTKFRDLRWRAGDSITVTF